MPAAKANDSVDEASMMASDTLSSMIPSNLAEAEGLASMLAINAAADHLIERAVGRRIAQKVAVQAAQTAGSTVTKTLVKTAGKEAAKKAGTKMAAKAATTASTGPAGWIMLAVQVGGMLLDFFDPFNIARSYTNHDLQSMHDMMAGALTATLKGARACTDPSYTEAKSATDTTPEIMCLDDGMCIAMYPGQSKLTPPSTAQCFDLPFPDIAKPVMPVFDARVPSVILDVLSIEDGQGALLLHNWLANQPNADARIFDDRVVDASYRAFFNQAMNAEWQAAGSPKVPVADVAEPKNVDGESIEATKVMSQSKKMVPDMTAAEEAAKEETDNKKKKNIAGVVGAIIFVGLVIGGIYYFKRRRPTVPQYQQPMQVQPAPMPVPMQVQTAPMQVRTAPMQMQTAPMQMQMPPPMPR